MKAFFVKIFVSGVLLWFCCGCGFWEALKGPPAGYENRPAPFHSAPKDDPARRPPPPAKSSNPPAVNPGQVDHRVPVYIPPPGGTPTKKSWFTSSDELPLHLEGLSDKEAAIVRQTRGAKQPSRVWGNSSLRDAPSIYTNELKSLNAQDAQDLGRSYQNEKKDRKASERWVY